jgi:hypothetical protein
MIGFYYGTQIPGTDAKEGIYFINNDNKYSIYTKRDGEGVIKYGETNTITSANLDNLWNQIGETFVAKTFTVAGLSFENDITLSQMQEALKLQALAYKREATGTLTDYVTEVEGVNYTPTGTVEVILGYGKTATVISKGMFTPQGTISGTVLPQGNVFLQQDNNGFAVSGSVSAPDLTIIPNTEKITQITGVGTLPSYTPAQYTAPTLTSATNSFTTEGMVGSIEGNVLKFTAANKADAVSNITYTQGEYITAQFDPGTLPTMNNNLAVVTGIASAEASAPIFTGDKIKAQFTGITSDIDAQFTGTPTEIEVSGEYKQATVDSASFTGQSQIITPSLVKENKTVTVS